jgi:hypothetical protein
MGLFGFIDDAWNAATGAAGDALGTKTTAIDKTKIDPNNYNDASGAQFVRDTQNNIQNQSAQQATQAKAATDNYVATANAGQSQGTQVGQVGMTDGQQALVQQGLEGQLQQQAAGQGPSVAQQAYNQANSHAAAQAMSLAAAGGNSALGQRQAQMAAAQANQANAAGLAQGRAQEQLSAQSQLAGLATNARGQDQANRGQNIGLATTQAGLTQSNNQFNVSQGNAVGMANAQATNTVNMQNTQNHQAANLANQAATNQQQQFNSTANQANQQLINNRQQYGQNLQVQKQQDQINVDNAYNSQYSANANAAKSNAQATTQGVLKGIASVAAASDKTLKEDVDPTKNRLDEWLGKLQSYDYNYKNPNEEGTSEGRKTSVMAQDLEKSEIGKDMVFDRADGKKMVDYGKALPALVAAVAEQHKDLEDLKSIAKRRK